MCTHTWEEQEEEESSQRKRSRGRGVPKFFVLKIEWEKEGGRESGGWVGNATQPNGSDNNKESLSSLPPEAPGATRGRGGGGEWIVWQLWR